MNADSASKSQLRVQILEQPHEDGLRFRYKQESRPSGSIPGKHSSPGNRTCPAIGISGVNANEDLKLKVKVSLVTEEYPFCTHVHSLVGKNCDKGIYTGSFPSSITRIEFRKVGIQCVKKNQIEEILKQRRNYKKYPFIDGFRYAKNDSSSNKLNSVRMYFQVLLVRGKCVVQEDTVVSDPIHDRRGKSTLSIVKLSHDKAPAQGGLEMIILCEKVTKGNIKVKFYTESSIEPKWKDFASIQLVYKQFNIVIKTPAYRDPNVPYDVPAFVQLYRPSDGKFGKPKPFTFTSVTSAPVNGYESKYPSSRDQFMSSPVSLKLSPNQQENQSTDFPLIDLLSPSKNEYNQNTPSSSTSVECLLDAYLAQSTTLHQEMDQQTSSGNTVTYYTNDTTTSTREGIVPGQQFSIEHSVASSTTLENANPTSISPPFTPIMMTVEMMRLSSFEQTNETGNSLVNTQYDAQYSPTNAYIGNGLLDSTSAMYISQEEG